MFPDTQWWSGATHNGNRHGRVLAKERRYPRKWWATNLCICHNTDPQQFQRFLYSQSTICLLPQSNMAFGSEIKGSLQKKSNWGRNDIWRSGAFDLFNDKLKRRISRTLLWLVSLMVFQVLPRIIVCCSGTELQAQRAYTADLWTGFRILRGSTGSGNIGSTYFSCNGPESSSWLENQEINRVSHFHSCCIVFWSFLRGSGKKVRLLILLSTFRRWLLFLRILEGHFFRNIFLRTFDAGLHWSNSCWHC